MRDQCLKSTSAYRCKQASIKSTCQIVLAPIFAVAAAAADVDMWEDQCFLSGELRRVLASWSERRPLLKIHFSIATSNQQWFATPRGIRHKYYKWCKFWVEQENYVRIKDTRTLIWLYLRSPANRGFSQSIFVAFEHINASLYWPAPTRLGPLSPLLVGLVTALL